MMKNETNKAYTCIAFLAHVDAGKTTLLKNMARCTGLEVLLDYHAEEKRRGITILTKLLELKTDDRLYTFLDTPGHPDLRSEVRASLNAADYVVVLIDVTQKLTASSLDLFKMLKTFKIPFLIFLNKYDLGNYYEEAIISALKQQFNIIELDDPLYQEEIAALDEKCLEDYLNGQSLDETYVKKLFQDQNFVLVFKGAAVDLDDCRRFLAILDTWTYPYFLKRSEDYLVFKQVYIDHELYKYVRAFKELSLKMTLGKDKVEAIELYTGNKFEHLKKIEKGRIALVKGLDHLLLGHHLDFAPQIDLFRYEIDYDKKEEGAILNALREQSIERPDLKIDLLNKPYTIALNSRLEGEIFEALFREHYNLSIKCDRLGQHFFETIKGQTESYTLCDDYYIHLMLTPYEQDELRISGLLDQKIADMFLKTAQEFKGPYGHNLLKINFAIQEINTPKQADPKLLSELFTRAIAMALDNAGTILLALAVRFSLAFNDYGKIEELIRNYELKVLNTSENSYEVKTGLKELAKLKERGEEIKILGSHYEPSDQIPLSKKDDAFISLAFSRIGKREYDQKTTMELLRQKGQNSDHNWRISDKQALEAFKKAYPEAKDKYVAKAIQKDEHYHSKTRILETVYVIDAYNLLYASKIDRSDLSNARDQLLELLYTYKNLKGVKMWVIFDAYLAASLKANEKGDDFKIVFTKKDEKADTYIERLIDRYKKQYRFIVVTSDGPLQNTIFTKGASRLSSRAFLSEYERLYQNMQKKLKGD